jgi:hypothetical protein
MRGFLFLYQISEEPLSRIIMFIRLNFPSMLSGGTSQACFLEPARHLSSATDQAGQGRRRRPEKVALMGVGRIALQTRNSATVVGAVTAGLEQIPVDFTHSLRA